MFIATAYAMGAPGSGAQGGGGGMASLVMMLAIFGIFYFLLIRPQQRKMKEHKKMVEELKKGARIITAGGLYGTVEGVGQQSLTVKIAEGTKVKLSKGSVAAVLTGEEADKD